MTRPTQNLWSALPLPAIIVGPEDQVLSINPAAEQFLNNSERALVGAPVWDRVLVDAPLGDALDRVRQSNAEIVVNNVDVSSGSTTPERCHIQFAPFGSSGEVLVLIQPRQLAQRLGRAQLARTAARSAIGMAEMLAHEIKNPLAGITGAAQLLAMNLEPAEQELTDLIVAESRRILALLEQVDAFGNLQPPNLSPVNIHDILDRAQKSASVGFAAHMHFTKDYDPSLPLTLVDGDQIIQVVLNLLKNAAEASDRTSGNIQIRTYFDPSLRLRQSDGTGNQLPLRLEITDDGPGFSSDLSARLFEPFVSGRENGTGLGLAVVSKIISDHGGWIDADSVPGRTTFRIALPIAPKEEVT